VLDFNVVYGNHWNFGIGVGDTIRYLSKALNDFGCNSRISKEPCNNSVNFFIENFDEGYVLKIKELKEKGGYVVVVCTEFLTGCTFNDFMQVQSGGQYSDKEYWLGRFSRFLEIVPLCDSICHLSDIAAIDFSNFLNRNVHYLPHRYVNNYKSVIHRSDSRKDIDFLFTGTVTDYRMEILNELKKRGFNVEMSGMLTAQFYRDDLISRAKICLNIPQSAAWKYPSQSRYFYHIINDSLVLSFLDGFRSDLDDFISLSSDNFIESCIRELSAGEFNYRASIQNERFKILGGSDSYLKVILDDVYKVAGSRSLFND
jgi:hypothetical protein